jgi:hypothetical protein
VISFHMTVPGSLHSILSTPPSLSNCVQVFISKTVVILTVKLSLHSERVVKYRESKLNIKEAKLLSGRFKICVAFEILIFIRFTDRGCGVVSVFLVFGRPQVQVSAWKLSS